MYLSFFGLAKTPFHITPDPDFLFLSAGHKEAYATVFYGVEERKGFVVLSGEVGTGKTTVLRYYLGKLNRQMCRPIYLFNPDMTFDELLDYLLQELKIDVEPGLSAAVKLQRLHWGLVKEYKQQRNIVLLIDEAQNMPVDTLEKLRMLSNLETTRDKLLQIVLVGQPELETKLGLHELRQLRQRVAVRATLHPLNAEECRDYIEHRLTVAGTDPAEVFTKNAMAEIVEHAKGSPRTINIVCDNALIAGFGAQQRPIDAGLIRQVVSDLQGGAPVSPRRPARYSAAIAVAAALVAVVGAGLYALTFGAGKPMEAASDAGLPGIERMTALLDHTQGLRDQAQSAGKTQDSGEPEGAGPAGVLSETRDETRAPEEDAIDHLPDAAPMEEPHAPVAAPSGAGAASGNALPVLNGHALALRGLDGALAEEEWRGPWVASHPEAASDADADADSAADILAAEEAGAAEIPAAPETVELAPSLDGAVAAAAVAETSAAPDAAGPVRIVVAEGDTLLQLVRRVYGRVTPELIAGVRAANPQIVDEDVILHGDALVFPKESPRAGTPGQTGSDDDQDL